MKNDSRRKELGGANRSDLARALCAQAEKQRSTVSKGLQQEAKGPYAEDCDKYHNEMGPAKCACKLEKHCRFLGEAAELAPPSFLYEATFMGLKISI